MAGRRVRRAHPSASYVIPSYAVMKMSPSIFYSGVEPPRILHRADHAAAGGQRYSSFTGPALPRRRLAQLMLLLVANLPVQERRSGRGHEKRRARWRDGGGIASINPTNVFHRATGGLGLSGIWSEVGTEHWQRVTIKLRTALRKIMVILWC